MEGMNNLSLAERDKIFTDLKYKIQCKQDALLERFANVKSAASENKLLEGVLEDYVKYFKDALAAKKREEEALTVLRNYLDTMGNAISISDLQMDYLKGERNKTINRLKDVRRDMEQLIDKTGVKPDGDDYDDEHAHTLHSQPDINSLDNSDDDETSVGDYHPDEKGFGWGFRPPALRASPPSAELATKEVDEDPDDEKGVWGMYPPNETGFGVEDPEKERFGKPGFSDEDEIPENEKGVRGIYPPEERFGKPGFSDDETGVWGMHPPSVDFQPIKTNRPRF